MRWQLVAHHGIGIGQAREVRAEMTLGERLHEAGFQPGTAARRVQRQGGIQLQRPRGIVFHSGIQGVEQPVRLAQREWGANAQGAIDPLQQPVDGGVQVGQVFGHAALSCEIMRVITAFPV